MKLRFFALSFCLFASGTLWGVDDFITRNLGSDNVEIEAYSGTSQDVVIPERLGNKRVVSVGASAFLGKKIRSVELPDGVTAIKRMAFAHCRFLERVKFPKTLKVINDRAFFACSSLKKIELPLSLERIDEEAFALCRSLEEISAPKFLSALGEYVFPLSAPGLYPDGSFPLLEVVRESLDLIEPSGNNAIDADESCTLRIPVANSGTATAYGSRVMIALKEADSALTFPALIGIPKIAPGENVFIEVPITASHALKDGEVDFLFDVDEPKGFGIRGYDVGLTKKAFVPPELKIADWVVEPQRGELLSKNVPFTVELYLENASEGTAEDVAVEVTYPDRTGEIYTLDGQDNRKIRIEKFTGGDKRTLKFELVVPNYCDKEDFPFEVKISEKYGKYAQNWSRTISLNTAGFGKTVVAGKESVDFGIPENASRRNNVFACIIANEDYEKVEDVRYAINDGEVFKKYCQETLGVPESNIIFYKNAEKYDIQEALKRLKYSAKNTENAEIIFYYSGHGVPDLEEDEGGYLLAVDVPAQYATSEKAWNLNNIYKQLGELNADLVTVFIDACFSGKQRDDSMLVAVKGVEIYDPNGRVASLADNMIVFTAASGYQTAHWVEEEKHGLFTYVLLKKLKETKGEVSFSELGEFLRSQVPLESIERNKEEQIPSIYESDDFERFKDRKLYDGKAAE